MGNRNTGRVVWGLAFVITGAIFASNALGFTEVNLFFDGWWTLFIIVPSLAGLLGKGKKIGHIIGLVIGVVLLLSVRGIIDLSSVWQLLVPIMLILIGLNMIFTSLPNRKTSENIAGLKEHNPTFRKETATFSAHKVDYSGEVFEGVSLDAVFGNIVCDLRQAVIEKDCLITASVVFAGIEIKVPDNVQVKVDSNVILGGVSNDTKMSEARGEQEGNPVILYIEANCIFGGIEIK